MGLNVLSLPFQLVFPGLTLPPNFAARWHRELRLCFSTFTKQIIVERVINQQPLRLKKKSPKTLNIFEVRKVHFYAINLNIGFAS
jgi:hypothetical protein